MTSAVGLPRNAASAPLGRGGNTCDMRSAVARQSRSSDPPQLANREPTALGGEIAALGKEQEDPAASKL